MTLRDARFIALGLALALFFIVRIGGAQNRPPIPAPVFKAVRAYWKTKPERIEAFNVCYCESRFWPYARNGQYLGLFQFGEWARSTYNWGWGLYEQARAAHAYYADSGWSGWECQP